jgi:hypothetical protein
MALVAVGCGTSAGATRAPSAARVFAAFRSARLPVSRLIVYTAASDPNHLLGRPNGYVSKVAWVDRRVKHAATVGDSTGDLALGGTVEVFATSSDAAARARYVQTIEKAAPILGSEYDYVKGAVLARISGLLTPAQAASYGRVLRVAAPYRLP